MRFERKSAWASLLLENGDEVSLLAVQAVDREHAVRAVEGLRALHAAARASDPVAAAAALRQLTQPGMTRAARDAVVWACLPPLHEAREPPSGPAPGR